MAEPAFDSNALESNNPVVSILIRTKNEERHIGQTLSVLFSQTYRSYEVIIVDSGSTDSTLDIAGNYPVRIFEIKPEEFTWGYALNYGFQRTRAFKCLVTAALLLALQDEDIYYNIRLLQFDCRQILMKEIIQC